MLLVLLGNASIFLYYDCFLLEEICWKFCFLFNLNVKIYLWNIPSLKLFCLVFCIGIKIFPSEKFIWGSDLFLWFFLAWRLASSFLFFRLKTNKLTFFLIISRILWGFIEIVSLFFDLRLGVIISNLFPAPFFLFLLFIINFLLLKLCLFLFRGLPFFPLLFSLHRLLRSRWFAFSPIFFLLFLLLLKNRFPFLLFLFLFLWIRVSFPCSTQPLELLSADRFRDWILHICVTTLIFIS